MYASGGDDFASPAPSDGELMEAAPMQTCRAAEHLLRRHCESGLGASFHLAISARNPRFRGALRVVHAQNSPRFSKAQRCTAQVFTVSVSGIFELSFLVFLVPEGLTPLLTARPLCFGLHQSSLACC